MKSTFRHLLAFFSLGLGLMQSAAAQDATAYIVSYIEVAPAAQAQARGMIAQMAKASRKDAGNLQFIALQRIGEPNHFAILEAWKDKDAQAAHGSAAHTKEFRDKLTPLQRSPYDERPHGALAVASPSGNAGKGAIWVVTHADIVPTSKDLGLDLCKGLADSGRKDTGNIRFDALQQASRPNHVTLVEVWKDKKSVDAHGVSAGTIEYRQKFTPLSGALYDERFYNSID